MGDTVESVFYMGFNRVLYACCIAWVIIACAAGYGGFATSFLDLGIWRFLSKLTYSAYFCQFLIIIGVIGNQEIWFNFTMLNATYWFIGNMTLCFLVALVAVVTIEMPITGSVKVLLSHVTPKIKSQIRDNTLMNGSTETKVTSDADDTKVHVKSATSTVLPQNQDTNQNGKINEGYTQDSKF